MPALSRGQANTSAIINWFLTVNGALTDAYAIQFRVFDVTAGLPGTQVFPSTPDTWEDVSGNSGHFGVGSYYAYDGTLEVGWTPGLAESVGTHRAEWRWKISAAAPWQSGYEDFEVLVQSAGSSADLYISVQDIRDEGIKVTKASDLRVLSAIETWQAFLERACRQWFVPKQIILRADGTDSDTLHLGVPIINIDYIKLNDNESELDPSAYRVYNGRTYPDDRRNPRVKLINIDDTDIYTAPLCNRLRFRKGRQNQEIKGTFGFIEDDGSTPRMIKRALTILVIEKLTKALYVDPDDPSSSSSVTPPPIMGGIVEEQTDDHRVRYGGTSSTTGSISQRKPGLTGITQNLEVLDIIKLYKAPIGIATPAHSSLI
jgi:hypothetical protein